MKPSSMPRPDRITGTKAIFCDISSPVVSLMGVVTALSGDRAAQVPPRDLIAGGMEA